MIYYFLVVTGGMLESSSRGGREVETSGKTVKRHNSGRGNIVQLSRLPVYKKMKSFADGGGEDS